MHTWQAALLGLIQGVTEFFPVSSSTHLLIVKQFLGIETGADHLFDLACHTGSLLALVCVFLNDFLNLKGSDLGRLVLALLPLAPIYLVMKFFMGDVSIGPLMITSGALMWFASMAKTRNSSSKLAPLYIGAAQGLALLPGVSRSGTTISCARLLGWDAQKAVRFSFMLAVPTVLGGTLLEGMQAGMQWEGAREALVGLLVAFVVGLFALRFALKILERGILKPFACYCMLLGSFLIMVNA